MFRAKLVIASVLVLLATSCASPTTNGNASPSQPSGGNAESSSAVTNNSEPAPIAPEELDGSAWSLRFGGGPEGDVALVDDWPVTLTFSGLNLSGRAACNGYGASFAIDGSALSLSGIGSESAGCAPEVQEAERAYLAALQDIDTIHLSEGQLALSGPSSELIFSAETPAPSRELVGAIWLLEALVADGTPRPVAGDTATLRLQPDGSFSGETGCRTFTGNFVVSGSEVFFTDFGLEGNCRASLQSQDSTVVTVLGDGFRAQIDGSQLVLTSVGNQQLRYRLSTEAEVANTTGIARPSDEQILEGVAWVFVGGDGPNGPIADSRSAGNQQITFVLGHDVYSGTAFCNDYGGIAEVIDGEWALGVPNAELGGCGDELDAIAATFLDALPRMREFAFEAGITQLVTNGEDIELRFERLQ